jgi:MFS family permease
VGQPPVHHSGVRRRHFGLLGGYLTDRLGRRRVLTYSILICDRDVPSGFSSIEMLLVLRCFRVRRLCAWVRRRRRMARRALYGSEAA